MKTISKAARNNGRHVPALLQQPDHFNAVGSSLHDTHQDSVGEATNIVDQVAELSQTFAEDKASSVSQENDLQTAFSALLGQKQAIIASLTGERDAQQAILNSVTQQIAEHEGAQQSAQTTLTNEQAYLQQLQSQEHDTTELYHARQVDRENEKAAVQQAHELLSAENPALLQMQKSQKRRVLLQFGAKKDLCKHCRKAAALLTNEAKQYHSELLATAAATTGSADALGPVITQLEDLIHRLDEEAESETKHKDWCDKEISATSQKKARHEDLVKELNTAITDTQATIADKQQALSDNQDAVSKVDSDFTDLTNIRTKAKADFDAELQDYVDAIAALNEAMDMLAQFYQESGGALIQTHHLTSNKHKAKGKQPVVPDAAVKTDAPEMGSLSGDYEQKGGQGVLQVLQEVRTEFEAGKTTLVSTENTQASEFEAAKTSYNGNRAALVDAGNRFTVELQTAQGELAAHQGNLASNTEEANAATNYLTQVGGSCDSLNAHFDDRQALRAQEKTAIGDAIEVLRAA